MTNPQNGIKIMQTKKLLISLIILAALLSGCKSNGTVIKVDGQWKDIPQELKMSDFPTVDERNFDESQNMYYAIFNDNERLFVNLEFISPIDKRKVLMHGSTVWLNFDGKTKKTYGVEYPIIGSSGFVSFSGRGGRGERGGRRPSINENQLIAEKKTIKLIGFGDEDEQIDHLEPGSVNAAMSLDSKSGNLLYSIIIPLDSLAPSKELWKDDVEKLAIGFETAKVEMPSRRRSSSSGLGALRDGMFGQGPRGNTDRSAELNEPKEFWFNYSFVNRK